MDVTQYFAVAAGGIFGVVVIVNFIAQLAHLWRTHLSATILRHVIYPFFLSRHRFVGPWTRTSVLLHLFYWAAMGFCCSFRVTNLTDASARAGTLSLINMIPLYSSFHLSFVADMLGISLRAYRRLHGSVGYVAGALTIFHTVINVTHGVSQPHSRTYGLMVSLTNFTSLNPNYLGGRLGPRGFHTLFLRADPAALLRAFFAEPPSALYPDYIRRVAAHPISFRATLCLHCSWRFFYDVSYPMDLCSFSKPCVPARSRPS